jgi:hypothetical protein
LVRFNASLATCVRDLFAKALLDRFGAATLSELPRAFAKANDLVLRPMNEGASA